MLANKSKIGSERSNMGDRGQGPRRQSRDWALNTSGIETIATLLGLAYGGDTPAWRGTALTLKRRKALRN